MNTSSKVNIIEKYGYSLKEIGSTIAQIILLTHKIKSLTNHFKKHHKDHHSRLGLFKMTSKRKKLMKYLKYNKKTHFEQTLNKLGLNKKI